jgi:hypothetical protein
MNQIKHSKYKNTGIIFELLVRQVTNDVLATGDSPAVKILKKYFSNSELAKEQRLYNLVNTQEKLTESKAEAILQTIAETALKFDLPKLQKEKYNLIKEIKKHYDLENFFKNKINNYKTSAAVYTLLESYRSAEYTDPKQVVNNKITLLEHLTQKEIINSENEDIKLFLQESKDIRILTYRMLIEKFNDKYSTFSPQQKVILKEYINNINDAVKLKKVVNDHFNYLKLTLNSFAENIQEPVTKIKITESIKLIKPIQKNESPKEEHLINLLQYYELLSEIKKVI